MELVVFYTINRAMISAISMCLAEQKVGWWLTLCWQRLAFLQLETKQSSLSNLHWKSSDSHFAMKKTVANSGAATRNKNCPGFQTWCQLEEIWSLPWYPSCLIPQSKLSCDAKSYCCTHLTFSRGHNLEVGQSALCFRLFLRIGRSGSSFLGSVGLSKPHESLSTKVPIKAHTSPWKTKQSCVFATIASSKALISADLAVASSWAQNARGLLQAHLNSFAVTPVTRRTWIDVQKLYTAQQLRKTSCCSSPQPLLFASLPGKGSHQLLESVFMFVAVRKQRCTSGTVQRRNHLPWLAGYQQFGST